MKTSRLFGMILIVGGLLASRSALRAQLFQSDDFNDGNDTVPAPGWTRYNPFATVGANIVQWSFPNGGYRIRTTAPSPIPSQLGPGRAGSLRSEVYTNFYISVDIVNWNDALPQAAGILARVQNPGLGTTIGYAFTWSRGNTTSATSGGVDFSLIAGEAPTAIPTTGADSIHLEPGKSYRFVFIGRGPNLEGRVYELPDTTTPKIDVTGTDATYEHGAGGLVIYDNSSGGGTNVCDITFDNFYATDVEPPRLILTDLTFGDYELSWPAEASSFILQTSSAATGANWEDVTENIVEFPDHFGYFFSVSPNGPNRFFRLIRR
jgi:hypothetical protein